MNHSLHTNYQTSFRIVRNNDQSYFDAIRSIYDWICTKEREDSLRKGWNDFCFNGSWEHCYRSNAKIQTSTYLEDDRRRAWSMEYTHADRDIGAKRFWHTYVGIRDSGDSLVISARNAYSWNNEDLSSDAPPPQPSVPYFIRLLVQNFTAYSGRKEFRLIEKPLLLDKPGSGQLIRDFVGAAERRYPLIVFNGSTETQLREAKRLATELTGKAQIVVLASDSALGKELKSSIPRDYYIGYGSMRVFFPFGDGPPKPQRHRWFDVASDDYSDQRDGIVHGLLRNHNLVEKDSVESIADIHRLISRSKIEKLKESTTGANAEEIHKLYQDYIKEVEGQRDSAKLEAEHYAQQIDQLESELQAATWKNTALSSSLGAQNVENNIRSALIKLPQSLEEVVTVASQIHSDRLIFAKEAYESAEESSECELVADAWCILYHIATTLYDLKFATVNPGDIGKLFQEKSGYEYARTEGKQTKNDKNLRRQRTITHNGKDYEIWPHIKKGNDGNKMIRIHFDFDNELRKIVVGYVGLHMDNASTRGRK